VKCQKIRSECWEVPALEKSRFLKQPLCRDFSLYIFKEASRVLSGNILMAEQSKKQTIRNTTLQTLVKQTGLTSKEIAQLRLSDLHLAGKKPNITFSAVGSNEPKSVELDLEAHRALVGWLVARPDSASDFLFPGQGAEPMAWQEIQQLVDQADTTPAAPPPQPEPPESKPKTPVKPGSVGKPQSGPPKPTPPRSAPELGAPPPGMMGGREPIFQSPPTTAPEAAAANIPLPTSTPKPTPTPVQSSRPLRPTPVPIGSSQKPASQPVAPSTKKDTGDKAKDNDAPSKTPIQESVARQSRPASRFVIPIVVIVILLLCGACGFGGWSIWQSDAGNTLLARLGITNPAAESFPNEREIIASLTPPAGSPIPTPTLPPTSTPTSLPVTDTPVVEATPTNTPVSETTPTETPTPEVIPTETETPVSATTPADTATSAPPAGTPTPEATPTVGMKYPAPTLLEPEDGTKFIQGNIIVLRWQPIPDLAPDEQYALRMFYSFENEPAVQGTNTRDAEWTVPPSLYGQIDGPDNLYEWFVVIERLNDDGSGTAISPESEHWKFTWK
jgi:hypothetical protein